MISYEALLQDVPQATIDAYQSYLRLHLKELMVILSKAKIEDINDIKLKSNECILKCYHLNKHQDPATRIWNIRNCKSKCKQKVEQTNKYLDDINFYSKKKLSKCSHSCILKSGKTYPNCLESKEVNQCLWRCLNRLDRRYKKYWMEYRLKAEQC